MITRKNGVLALKDPAAVPANARKLEQEGWACIPGVLSGAEIDALKTEIDAVFDTSAIDRPRDANNEFRYAMLNRSALCQSAIGARAILDVIEPLLGEDCHVIANTAWRNAAGHQGGAWHIDAGPHVPRAKNIPWPDDIPYPVFAVGMHLYLEDCPMNAGPTAVLAGSHRSGRIPEGGFQADRVPDFEGKSPVYLTARAGDACIFVSDVWHRGTPAEAGQCRFFLQAHYARRDIAQRLVPTGAVNPLTVEAVARATTDRARTLIGLHEAFFYDG
jgi:ectoine hydroxylase-related dioxygenase (phytanoyl-CoA dioxygenase family)